MKNLANVMKFVVGIEMALFFGFTDKAAMEIVILCLAQYAVFFPVDASVIIKNIKAAG